MYAIDTDIDWQINQQAGFLKAINRKTVNKNMVAAVNDNTIFGITCFSASPGKMKIKNINIRWILDHTK